VQISHCHIYASSSRKYTNFSLSSKKIHKIRRPITENNKYKNIACDISNFIIISIQMPCIFCFYGLLRNKKLRVNSANPGYSYFLYAISESRSYSLWRNFIRSDSRLLRFVSLGFIKNKFYSTPLPLR